MLLEVAIVHLSPGFAECLPTLIALVRHLLLWCVYVSVVLDKTGLGTKTLTTIIALKWLLASVDPLMDLEEGHMGESLGAEGTGVCK